MKVIVAENAGVCFGVKEALKMAEDMIKFEGDKFSLGEIIHNPVVTSKLKEKGLEIRESIEDIPANSNLLIRAHGAGPDIYKKAYEKNLNIYDATCPIVHKIHNLIKEKYNEGYGIIIYGSKNHAEVIGINGYCDNNGIIIDNEEKANSFIPEKDMYCMISQTTMIKENYERIFEILKKRIAKLAKFDTICTATQKRQTEAVELAKKADIMIVVGGKNSSNTLKLYEICKQHCEKTYFIEQTDELSSIDINNKMTICITAGASTPDWIVKEVKEEMEDKERQGEVFDFEKAFEESLATPRTGQVVKGKVISLSNNEVYVDLGTKIDGTIPIEEFETDSKGNPLVKKGDEVEAMIIKMKESDGVVTLSKKRVDDRKKLEKIDELLETGEAVKVTVKQAVTGGLLVDVLGFEGFIPASQLSDRYIRNLDKYVGRKTKARVIEHNRKKKKLILSRRVLIEEENEKIEKEVWSNIEVGKTITGKVKSFTNFGAFVDVGGIDGLVHITELSWNKIKHPSEVLEIGQDIEVVVKDFVKSEKRISLGYRKEEDDVWYKADEKYAPGTVVKGKIVRILPFGAFVEIQPGIDALVHISQISTKRINSPSEVLKEGMEVEMAIIDVDMDNKKINASIKAVQPYDPEITEKPVEKVREKEKEEKKPRQKERTDENKLPTSHTEDLKNTIGDILGSIKIDEEEK